MLALILLALTARLSEIAPAYSSTSVNAAIFRANPVVTYAPDSTQYAAFYDPEGRVTLASRRLGSDDWTVSPTQYTGKVADAHNVISIAVDSLGYLHASFDHHGHPLRYARSVAPGSLTLGPLRPMTGDDEQDVTYPEFHTLPDGSLLFAYRSGASGRGNMVLNRYDAATDTWHRLHDILIDGEGQRNAYWQMAADAQGTLHLSWVWRETWLVETNHDLCYARSADGGRTWTRSDSTLYSLPITIATAETACRIPQNSELINQTSMTATPDGHPMIATYWRDADDSVPQFRLVSHDGREWRSEIVGRRATPFSLSGGGTKSIPISRPKVVADTTDIYYIFRDAERGSRITVATRPLGEAGEWQLLDLTDYSVVAWEPSIDMPLWTSAGQLHVYAQPVSQGDGEKVVESAPTQAAVLEVNTGR